MHWQAFFAAGMLVDLLAQSCSKALVREDNLHGAGANEHSYSMSYAR